MDVTIDSILENLKDYGLAVFNRVDSLTEAISRYRMQSMVLAVCVSGEISATIDLKKHLMTPGSILVLRPGHVIDAISKSDDFDGFFILVGSSKIAAGLPTLARMIPCALHFMDNPIVSLTQEEVESQRMLFELLKRKIKGENPYNDMVVKALCDMIFYETLGIYTSHMNSRQLNPSRREELMMRFAELVENDFRRERTVLYYANKLCVTPKHLSSVVKETSGRTAGEWIDEKVVQEASMMLRNSGMTIQEISIALNFPNQSFFGKYFKHHTGQSPRAFRSNR